MDIRPKDVFGKNGIISKYMPNFEYRPEQEIIMESVSQAISKEDLWLIEAGTGVGKTLAYLVPCILSKRKTIVATKTRTLMDQIFQVDIPFLKRSLSLDINATLLKGRSNYLCLKKLASTKTDNDLFEERDISDLDIVQGWAEKTETGDVAELTMFSEDNRVIRRVVSSIYTCDPNQCPFTKHCFFLKARARAKIADIVITNHHLFFADLSGGEEGSIGILPKGATLIIDEAHALEEVATEYLGHIVDDYTFLDILDEVKRLRSHKPRGKTFRKILRDLPERYRDLVASLTPNEGKVRIRPNLLDTHVKKDWYQVDAYLVEMRGLVESLSEKGLVDKIEEIRNSLRLILEEDDKKFVRYAERHKDVNLIGALPIEIGDYLRQMVFLSGRPVVLTSATLSVADSTRFIRERLGIPDGSNECIVYSPFDFERQCLIYIPKGIHDPTREEYREQFIKICKELISICKGRTFILFTSYQAMHQSYDAMKDQIGFPSLIQGSAPRDQILREFKRLGNAVLFATQTFWEGVDVVGSALSCVVIDRLPFDPPEEPIIQARIECIREKGLEPFYEYQIPMAVMRLRQGFGRLIRSKTDKGVVAIMDTRIISRGYGKIFLKSLPKTSITYDLSFVKQWCTENLI